MSLSMTMQVKTLDKNRYVSINDPDKTEAVPLQMPWTRIVTSPSLTPTRSRLSRMSSSRLSLARRAAPARSEIRASV